MTRTDLKIKAQRLLHKDFRNCDLTDLFLALRNIPRSGNFVEEIGHFLAHSGERKKGPVFDAANDVVAAMRFHLRAIQGQALVGPNYPPELGRVLRYNARKLTRNNLAGMTGLPRKDIKALTESVLQKIKATPDSTQFSALTPDEEKMMVGLANWLITTNSVPADTIFEQFQTALIANSLITAQEKPLLLEAKPHIILFAMASMHLCEINCDEKEAAKITAGYHYEAGRRLLHLSVEQIFPFKGSTRSVAFSVMDTDLCSDDWCEPPLLKPSEFVRPIGVEKGHFPNRVWYHPLELTTSGKLNFLIGPGSENDPALQPYPLGSPPDIDVTPDGR